MRAHARARRVGLAAAVLTTLVGCGSSNGEGTDRVAGPPGASSQQATPSPATEPPVPTGRQAFSFDVAFRPDDPLAVVVRYGDSSTCPHEQVDAEVQESAQEVVVTLTALAQDGGPCTADYGARDVTLLLEQPLGDRRVVDGASSTDIAVAVGTPPGPSGSPVPLPDK